MIKQLIALIILSIVIIFAIGYMQPVMQELLHAHRWVANNLATIFPKGQASNIASSLIALLSIPLAIGLVPAIGYWMFKRRCFPYFTEIVWVVWLIQAGALMVISKSL